MNAGLVMTVSVLSLGQIPPLVHTATWSTGLESPSYLAVTDSEVLVADLLQCEIVRFDPAGTWLGSVPIPEGPLGIAAHPDGRVFIARRDDARVAVYDAALVFQRFLETGLGDFTRPTDLAVDSASGRIYVVDSGADRFYAFNADESLALLVGARGAHSSEFKYPSAVAADNGRIFVADQDNFRVQVFSSDGIYLLSFGYRNKYLPGGLEEGWFTRTAGLAIDSQGRIYVADALMGTVRLFDPTGVELGNVVGYGFGPGELRTPGGIALDAAGRLLVANSGAGSVELYDPPVGRHPLLRKKPAWGSNESSYDGLALLLMGPSRFYLDLLDMPGWDPPHMLDDLICGRCHGIASPPGGHEGLVEGQENLCFSCHTGAGQAAAALMRPTPNVGMSHAWGVAAVNPAYGSVGPTPGSELERYLDGGNIKCATCHDQHNNEAGTPYLRAAADAMCQECHADHTIHTPSGGWQPSCTECHAAHDLAAQNLALVRSAVHNQTLGADLPVVFTARTGANSFDDGDPATNDGICQVCHSATTYHTSDGTGAPHNDGATCTTCHPHNAGFMPAGGDCTACHNVHQDNGDGVPPGGRRAVVGEFPAGDSHAHYGSALDSDACLVCHSIATHMNGIVELVDADSGTLYSFQKPEDLTSDPDISDFCASCHDANGASRLADPYDPFGSGNAPPDVATRFKGTLQWRELYGDYCFGTEGTLRGVNSHHDISDADQAFSGAKIECLNCHGAHSSSASQPLADPFDTRILWTGSANGFCLSCHNGGSGPQSPGWPASVTGPTLDVDALRAEGLSIMDACTNGTGDCSAIPGIDTCGFQQAPWYIDYTWTNAAHGPNSKRSWESYSGAPGATLDCVVCHDPHGSYTNVNTTGNPYMIRDFVDGTPYVDDGYRSGGNWTGPPWNTFGTAGPVQVSISGTTVDWGNGLCVVCHSDWLNAQHFHDTCTACQTCHGHGMAWGEYDWGYGVAEDTPCPTGSQKSNNGATTPPPIHLRAVNRPTNDAMNKVLRLPRRQREGIIPDEER